MGIRFIGREEPQPFEVSGLKANGKFLANYFQGAFPNRNTADDGFASIAPVRSFPPNAYGLYDMIGNVWEWCADWYGYDYYKNLAGKTAKNPEGPDKSYDPLDAFAQKRVIKGGSYLCHESYCSNYRSSARMAAAYDSGLDNLGFRCIVRN